MQIPRRVYYATLTSLVIHGMLFGVLALTTNFTPDFQKSKEEALLAIAPQIEEPLEVVFYSAPKPEPTPPPTALMAPKPLDDAARAEVVALRTRLDPTQLQKVEAAPENPETIASHHSKATRARGGGGSSAARTQSLPKPTPVPATAPANPLFRTASTAPESPSAPPEPQRPGLPKGDRLPDPADADNLEESEAGSVAALGDWRQAVGNAIGIRWDEYRNSKKGALVLGTVRIRFKVDAAGKVSDVQVLSNTAGPSNAIYATRSIIEAQIPPIPAERMQKLPGGSVDITLTFTIYPNQ